VKFLLANKGLVKIIQPYLDNLKKIGILIEPEVIDYPSYRKRIASKKFDMMILKVKQSQYPGTEQRDLWHSSSARLSDSKNYYALKHKAVDFLVNKILYSKTKEDLVFYTKCLDRVLYHLHISVMNWYINSYRVAYNKNFTRYKNLPLYYSPLEIIPFMWRK